MKGDRAAGSRTPRSTPMTISAPSTICTRNLSAALVQVVALRGGRGPVTWRCSPSRIGHPEPNGSRRATPALLLQHRSGHSDIHASKKASAVAVSLRGAQGSVFFKTYRGHTRMALCDARASCAWNMRRVEAESGPALTHVPSSAPPLEMSGKLKTTLEWIGTCYLLWLQQDEKGPSRAERNAKLKQLLASTKELDWTPARLSYATKASC